MMLFRKIVWLTAGALAAAMVVGVVMFGTTGTAHADDPNATYQTINYNGAYKTLTCYTDRPAGAFGQAGAWGDFVDGCTVQLGCPSTNISPGCTAYLQTDIMVAPTARVTQNARMRILGGPLGTTVLARRDSSCSGFAHCENHFSMHLAKGRYASVQCNGVREHITVRNRAWNTCQVAMRYET